MRAVSKGKPPRNVSPDGQTPSSMQAAEKHLQATLAVAADLAAHARARFDGLDKKKLRAVLYEEQRHICVYCERRIAEGADVPPIEHWQSLSRCPHLALRWKNRCWVVFVHRVRFSRCVMSGFDRPGAPVRVCSPGVRVCLHRSQPLTP